MLKILTNKYWFINQCLLYFFPNCNLKNLFMLHYIKPYKVVVVVILQFYVYIFVIHLTIYSMYWFYFYVLVSSLRDTQLNAL